MCRDSTVLSRIGDPLRTDWKITSSGPADLINRRIAPVGTACSDNNFDCLQSMDSIQHVLIHRNRGAAGIGLRLIPITATEPLFHGD